MTSVAQSEASSGELPDDPTDECSACPEEAPYCEAGHCVACSPALEATACDETAPRCHASWDRCVECLVDEDCPADAFCSDRYTCTAGCVEHAQCPRSACNLARGICMDDAPLVYASPCDGEGTGSEDDPFCSIAAAIAALREQVSDEAPYGTLVVDAFGKGSEQTISFSDQEIVIDGGLELAIIGRVHTVFAQGTTGLTVTSGASAFLGRLMFVEMDGTAIHCTDGARVWADDLRLSRNARAIVGENCPLLSLRRSHLEFQRGNTIELRDGSQMMMAASIVGCNGSELDPTRALLVDDGSTFAVNFSTIAGNRSAASRGGMVTAANIECHGESGGVVRNSVVLTATLGAESIACPTMTMTHSATDAPSFISGTVVDPGSWDPSWFVSTTSVCNLRIADFGASPFADLAVWQLGDPRYDVDGESSGAPVPGAPAFAGADQPTP